MNVVLCIILAIVSGYFARNRILFSIYFGNENTVLTWLRMHWLEVATVLTLALLAIMWIVDMVQIMKGGFMDRDKMKLL